MKKLLGLLLLVPALTGAQNQQDQYITADKKVICSTTEFMVEVIKAAKEIPFWTGVEGNTRYSLFINEKSKEWTLVQFNKDVACIVGAGKQHKHLFLPNS